MKKKTKDKKGKENVKDIKNYYKNKIKNLEIEISMLQTRIRQFEEKEKNKENKKPKAGSKESRQLTRAKYREMFSSTEE